MPLIVLCHNNNIEQKDVLGFLRPCKEDMWKDFLLYEEMRSCFLILPIEIVPLK
jgi:hypothetical protein